MSQRCVIVKNKRKRNAYGRKEFGVEQIELRVLLDASGVFAAPHSQGQGHDLLVGANGRDTLLGGTGTNTVIGLPTEIDLVFTLTPDWKDRFKPLNQAPLPMN